MPRLPSHNFNSRASAITTSSGGGDPPKRPNNNRSGFGMGHYNERHRVTKTSKPKERKSKLNGRCYRCGHPRHGTGDAADCRRTCERCGKLEHFGVPCPEPRSSPALKSNAGAIKQEENITEGPREDLSNSRAERSVPQAEHDAVQEDLAQDYIRTLLSRINNLENDNDSLRAENARLRAQPHNQNAPLPQQWATEYPPRPSLPEFRNPYGHQQQYQEPRQRPRGSAPVQSMPYGASYNEQRQPVQGNSGSSGSPYLNPPQQHAPAMASGHGHPQPRSPPQHAPPQTAPRPDRQGQWPPWTPPPADTNASGQKHEDGDDQKSTRRQGSP